MNSMSKVAFLLLTMNLAACSNSIDNRTANGKFNYLKTSERSDLIVPNDLNSPYESKEFDIPPISPKGLKLGKELDIRPPVQVINIEGITIVDTKDTAKININNQDDIFEELLNFCKDRNISIENSNQIDGVIQTNVIEKEEILKRRWYWTNQVYSLKEQYKFKVTKNKSSTDLEVILLDREVSYDGDDEEQAILNIEEKKRATVGMLNNFINYITFKKIKSDTLSELKNDFNGLKIKNESGQNFFLAYSPYDLTWNRLNNALNKMDFIINDIDYSRGRFFISWEKGSFWSSLWSESIDLLPGDYVIIVEDRDKETRIDFLNKDEEYLSNQQIEKIYKNFSNAMKED